MACHVEVREFAGKPTPVFFCGEGARKKFCRFCGARATALCDWPKVRIVNVPFAALKIGDEVVASASSRQVHRLVYLAAKPELGQVWLATEWNGRVMERIENQPWRGMWAPRRGTCAAPACYRCVRCVGPDRHYCRRHWRAWEAIA